ncbi:MAG TPA: alpha/beta hydrolase, partial [Noviherbaspirillum sp.]
PSNHAAPINAHNGHPAAGRNEHGIRQRGWQYFQYFMRINRQASESTAGSPDFRHVENESSVNETTLGGTSSLSAGRNEIFRDDKYWFVSSEVNPNNRIYKRSENPELLQQENRQFITEHMVKIPVHGDAQYSELTALYLPPPKPNGKVIIFSGGQGEHLENRVAFMKAWHEKGFGVMTHIPLGCETESGEHRAEERFYTSIEAAANYVTQQGIPVSQQIVWGKSWGTAPAVHLASSHGEQCSQLIIQAGSPGIAHEYALKADSAQDADAARSKYAGIFDVSDKPVTSQVLVLHGGKDTWIPPEATAKFRELYGDNATVKIFADQGHGIDPRQYAPDVEHFLGVDESDLTQSLKSMRTCVTSALIPPQPGEQQQPIDEAWAAIYQFDAQRRSGENSFDLIQDFPDLDAIANDETHPSCADAKLLKDIMTRPVGSEAPSLEEYLAKKVEAGLDVYMAIPPNPDFRTFNSIQPGLATSTLDYNSAGRTVLFKGATHLIGIPSGPAVTDSQLTEGQLDRKSRLQKTMFSFPKHPADGVERLKLSDFDEMIDPLDNLAVYESSGPQLP